VHAGGDHRRLAALALSPVDFALTAALLDGHGNGAIFNGLYHRSDCRVLAKPVRDWKSTYSMSDEEIEAIRKAKEGIL